MPILRLFSFLSPLIDGVQDKEKEVKSGAGREPGGEREGAGYITLFLFHLFLVPRAARRER